MARALQMPGWSELPQGARRDFVEELFGYFREAKRPTLIEIERRIRDNTDLAGFASRETIRRMLTGQTVPPSWNNVFAVFSTLCRMAGHKENEPRWEEFHDPEDESRVGRLEYLWNAALDDPGPRPMPTALYDDDEPPF